MSKVAKPDLVERLNSSAGKKADCKMQGDPDPHDLGFSCRVRKNGDVEILHHGRLASTLRGNDAEGFKQEAERGSASESQQLMARVTGNYKHGNERRAAQHPRNRR